MKIESFKIDRYQVSSLLSAFRERKDVVIFWMQVVKTILSFVEPKPDQVHGIMLICTEKMHRVFVEADEKSFSASLPFSVKKVDGYFSCTLRSGIEIDSRLSSEVIAALSTFDAFGNSQIFGFADELMNISDDPDTLWAALSELINSDDGYLRFDHDPDREDGNLHPLNHIDIFFSQSATFKLGLKTKLAVDTLSDLLNIRTDCHYLTKE